MNRRIGTTLVAVALGMAMGCGSEGGKNQENGSGTLRMPLAATSYSATTYVLCQGIFNIYGYTNGQTWTIDASEHQTEAFVTQSLPAGGYEVTLSGWQICKATGDGLVPVEAQLWSSEYQYVEVNPLQASYVYFTFMVNGEQLAFDGQMVIQINVYENNYGTGGYYNFGGYANFDGGYGATGGEMPFPTSGGSSAYGLGGAPGL